MEATADPTPERLLRDSEVAALLGCSRSFVWRLIASEDLDSIHVGRLRRIPVSSVRAYIAARLRDEIDRAH
jgi:excisionase family DNA binding protein